MSNDIVFTNNASALLAATITDSDLTVQVAAGFGALFPSPTGGNYFYAVLEDDSGDIEIVKCTSRTDDILTVVRAQDGTTAQAFTLSVTRVELRMTKAVMEEFLQKNGGTITGTIDFNEQTLTDPYISGANARMLAGQIVNVPIRGLLNTATNEIAVPVDGTSRATVGAVAILATGDDIVAELDTAGVITLDSATVGVDMDQDGAYFRMRGAFRIAFDGGTDYLEASHDDTDFNFVFVNTEEVNWDTILNMAANIQLNDNVLERAELTDYSVTHQALTITANAATLDLELGNSAVVDLQAATGTVTLTVSNPPGSGSYGEFNMRVIQGSTAREITWPASFKWPDGGTAPVLTATDDAVDVISGFTDDGGTTWHATFAQDYS